MRKRGGLSRKSKKRLRKKQMGAEAFAASRKANFRESSEVRFARSERAKREKARRQYRLNSSPGTRMRRALKTFEAGEQRKESAMNFWTRNRA